MDQHYQGKLEEFKQDLEKKTKQTIAEQAEEIQQLKLKVHNSEMLKQQISQKDSQFDPNYDESMDPLFVPEFEKSLESQK